VTAASPRVVLAGCAKLPEGNGDEADAVAALGELGVVTEWARWDDPEVDFTAADLVVLRSTWDYPDRRTEFLEWCESVPGLCNPAPVARWNTDKTYLTDLAEAGVSIVPTELLAPGTTPRWPDTEFVLKPAVGVGSIGAARFAATSVDAARAHLEVLHAAGHTVLSQPYQSAVDSEGETALVFLGGVFSHAFTKGAMLTGSEVDGTGLFVSERLGVATPDPAQRTLAEDTLDAAAGLLRLRRSDLLYARVDLVRADDGRPALLELELTEPSLGFRHAEPAAALRFASAARARLGA
jgi:glutathione synthase/RimK-type ligase-like ATP-grasp enzyme